jgi:hypothetical protein
MKIFKKNMTTKKLFLILFILSPLVGYAQPGGDQPKDTNGTALTNLVFSIRTFYQGDTVVNLNALNNGITSYQISEESKKTIASNGLEIKEGAVIVFVEDSLLKKDFSFDIKTFASDKEWYENTVKVKVKDNDIRLISITSDKIEMATGFRKEGKIYVVIAVSAILFFVIIFYLIYLERKTKKLENQLKNL